MSTVFVRRLHAREEAEESLWKEIDDLENEIRQVAQRMSDARGGAPGDPEDDWVRAERQVCWSPQAELREDELAFRALIGVPGLDASDIEVTLLPDLAIVRGKGIRNTDAGERVHFSEFGSGTLFRKIPIPAPVHVDSAVVSFENGLLEISAAKVECNEDPVAALAASGSQFGN